MNCRARNPYALFKCRLVNVKSVVALSAKWRNGQEKYPSSEVGDTFPFLKNNSLNCFLFIVLYKNSKLFHTHILLIILCFCKDNASDSHFIASPQKLSLTTHRKTLPYFTQKYYIFIKKTSKKNFFNFFHFFCSFWWSFATIIMEHVSHFVFLLYLQPIIKQKLQEAGIETEDLIWYKDAFIIKKDLWNVETDVLSILIGVNDVWHEIGDSPNGVDADKFFKIYCTHFLFYFYL